MTTKDVCALIAILAGIASATFNYIIFLQGRKDYYRGDDDRAMRALWWATPFMSLMLVSAAGWLYCLINGIA